MTRPTPPLNVFIVEDEALIVMEMQFAIEDLGHCVLGSAASTLELDNMYLDREPHLVLVDLNLAHGTNGLDACRMISDKWRKAIVVFVTANPGRIPVNYEGSHGVIAKPFSHRGLEQAMRYLTQGICTPPPQLARPSSFIAFSNHEASWSN